MKIGLAGQCRKLTSSGSPAALPVRRAWREQWRRRSDLAQCRDRRPGSGFRSAVLGSEDLEEQIKSRHRIDRMMLERNTDELSGAILGQYITNVSLNTLCVNTKISMLIGHMRKEKHKQLSIPGPELSTQMEKGFDLSASSSALAAMTSKSSNWKVQTIHFQRLFNRLGTNFIIATEHTDVPAQKNL